MSGKLYKALVQERADLVREAGEIVAAAEREDRGLTDEEKARDDAIDLRLRAMADDIAREERRREREASVIMAGQPHSEAGWDYAPGGPVSTPAQVAAAAEPRFKSLGEQLQAVATFYRGNGLDPRLVSTGAAMGAATGLSEGVQSDGGFLVQHDIASALLTRMYDQGAVLQRCAQQPIGPNANGIKIPAVDETSRANGSRWGGIRAYWTSEAGTVTATQPKFRNVELNLQKLMALVYSTDELLADATALEAWIYDTVPLELLFVLEDAIINGDGVGKPLGILNAAALVTQAAEDSQTATTFNAQNAAKMRARIPARSRAGAAWLMNQDAEPQLPLMTLANMPVWQPNFHDAPGGTLLGHPVLPTEYNATLGAVGDVILTDLSQYKVATKGGIQSASSLHVRFLYDEAVFRFTYRVDGQPGWNSALTPFKGSNTQSPFVALAAR